MWAVETTAGTRPTSGYTELKNVESIPENNPQPEMLDTTVLSETEQRTGIPGLKGMADNMAIVANATNETYTTWDAFVTAAQALTGGKRAWICIQTPEITNCTYMQGMPSPKGSSAYEVNSILKTNLYFAPAGAPVFAAAPTAAQGGH